MSKFEKELERNMQLGKVAHERESIYSDFLVSKRDIERIFEDWKPSKPLVEVPQFVADWFEKELKNNESKKFDGNDIFRIIQDVIKVSNDEDTWEDWSITDEIVKFADDNEELFLNLIANCSLGNGYTVKKEQLYILKHIDMSKLSTDDSLYLAHGMYKKLQHVTLSKDVDVHNIDQLHFTKSEVDELNIGSYEQIEVDK